MSTQDHFEKFNQVNLIVSPEDIFDYMGAERAKEDGFKITYSCPYHADDSPSLIVDTRTGNFNCFACSCGGRGGYSCAKYYLEFQGSSKPTAMMVVNLMCEINPKVENYKYLFQVTARPDYNYEVNKRQDFKNRVKFTDHSATISVIKRSMTDEQVATYIDAVMTNMPEEFIIQALGVKERKNNNSLEGSKEFLALLGD
ncbi:CHC2 zinc finger domain-containing protein [Lysinibacillus xylanilyticus]|uniref:CHC2 zinc finger domain-containing protein n=1 Tax=Lysinibacillus xylanilyticus TaxID=582475 RepID=UPI0036D84E94